MRQGKHHLQWLAVLALAGGADAATIGTNFTGSNFSASGFFPPDTMGTVGPNHVVEMINGRYRVYNKTSGAILENRSLSSFWSTYGQGYSGSYAFDPRIAYDPSAGRYYAVSVDNPSAANNLLFAVSKTSNPLDGWTGYKIDADTDNQQWADFPQMGFDSHGVYVSSNMFGLSGGSFEINVLVLPKADLLATTPTIANRTLLETQYANTGYGSSWQPVANYDANSTTRTRLFSGNTSSLGLIELTGTLASPTVSNIADVSLPSRSSPPLANQPGSKTNLDSGGSRIRSEVVEINGSYWGVQGVRTGDAKAGIRWFQVDATTLALKQEGVIADANLDLFYASIAVNSVGDVVIGCTGSSETVFASAYAIVGDTNALGVTSFETPLLLMAGVSDYQRLDGGGRNRWGDYSNTVVDPSNALSFWTFQEYVSGTDQWAVQITQITVPEPASVFVMLLPALLLKRRRVA